MATGCGDDEDRSNWIEIPFSEFSSEEIDGTGISGMNLNWQGLGYNNSVIIVNSREEMEKYIVGNIGDYPEIDFSKHSLLLASGTACCCLDNVNVNNLWQISKNQFILDVEVRTFLSLVASYWHIALVTSKLNSSSNIRLNVNHLEIRDI